VRTVGSHSISMAITWKTREVRRLTICISSIRCCVASDGRKSRRASAVARRAEARLYRAVTTAIRPLRASLKMRRVLRRIALGNARIII